MSEPQTIEELKAHARRTNVDWPAFCAGVDAVVELLTGSVERPTMRCRSPLGYSGNLVIRCDLQKGHEGKHCSDLGVVS